MKHFKVIEFKNIKLNQPFWSFVHTSPFLTKIRRHGLLDNSSISRLDPMVEKGLNHRPQKEFAYVVEATPEETEKFMAEGRDEKIVRAYDNAMQNAEHWEDPKPTVIACNDLDLILTIEEVQASRSRLLKKMSKDADQKRRNEIKVQIDDPDFV